MFTGIVQGTALVKSIVNQSELRTLTIHFPSGTLEGVKNGASIAINGVCMTVTQFDLSNHTACFDAIASTLNITNIGLIQEGEQVNFERAAKVGDEIGGHLMSGHVFSKTRIKGITKTDTNHIIEFELPDHCAPYILDKGYIGLNGCSLTIAKVSKECFWVYLIPETLAMTTFDVLGEGAEVNIELDPQTQTIVDTVERVLASRQ